LCSKGDVSRPRTEGRYLWALDPASGKVRWRHRATVDASDDSGQCVTTPAVSGRLIVSTVGHVVFALDEATGAPLWRQPVERMVRGDMRRRVHSEVLIVGGALYTYYHERLVSWSLSNGGRLSELP
jgi:outer membrane protein assembly factor BamB